VLVHLQAGDQGGDLALLRLARLPLGELLRRDPRHRGLPGAGLTGQEPELRRPQTAQPPIKELQSEVRAKLDARGRRRHHHPLLLDVLAAQVVEGDDRLRQQRRRRDLHCRVTRVGRYLVRRALLEVDLTVDRRGQFEQLAQVGLPLDDAGVRRRLTGRAGLSGGEALHLANGRLLGAGPRPRQRLRRQRADRQRVDRVVGVVRLDDLAVELAERRDVEVPRVQQRADDLADDLRVGEHLPDH
jgi:hypothetical protein